MKFPALLLAALFILGALAPGLATSQSGELILRVAMQDDMKGLNPLTVSDVWSWNVLGYIYDGPINTDPETDELIPYIAVGSANLSGKAESWGDCAIGNFGYSPKTVWANQSLQETIIFYDFENVKWHDGEQMDIRDVMFSMHVAAQVPGWSASMKPLKAANFTETGWLEVYKVWESPDGIQAALRFQVREIYASFFRDTLSTFLLPEHVWNSPIAGQPAGARIWCDHDYLANPWQVAPAQSYLNNPPIGSGPFKFVRWDKGQFIRVDTYRDHFFRDDFKYLDYAGTDEYGRSNARQPHIDAITYKIYRTAEAAVLALKSDDIDYIAWSIPSSFVQELTNTPGVALQQSPEPGFFYLGYNMRNPSFGYNATGDDVGKAFRRAAAHCIDKDMIVTRLLLNLGVAGTGPVSPLSEWHNESVPTYDFNPTKAKQILADAGYKVKVPVSTYDFNLLEGEEAIAAAGPNNWWVNPDGSNIGSGPGGKIDILTPESNYDPLPFSRGLPIAKQLRDVGIYAESAAMDFGSIVDRIDNRDFDMYILGWRIGSAPSDYLWAFFHSDNAQVGQNYAGYRNATFDAIIDRARATGDMGLRKQLVFDAQAAICYDLPYDVLYYRTNVEAYRSDRFTGWVVGDKGSIFNWKSIYNIRAPSPFKTIAQFVSPPSAVLSNSTTPISILVKDQDGNPLQGAIVKLNCSQGKLSADIGTTGANGRLEVTFMAPYADPNNPDAVMNGTQAIIQIVGATYVSSDWTFYDPAPSRLTLVRVFPEGAEFLSLSITADPDVINPDITEDGTLGFTLVTVTVTDRNGDPVAGANTALFSSSDGPTITPETQLADDSGRAIFTVIAPNLTSDDGSVREYLLMAMAIHPDDSRLRAENSLILAVVDAMPPTHGDPEFGFPVFEATITLGAIMAVAVVYAALRRRRRS